MNKKGIIGIILCSAFFDYRINDLQEPKRALRSSNRYAMMGSSSAVWCLPLSHYLFNDRIGRYRNENF